MSAGNPLTGPAGWLQAWLVPTNSTHDGWVQVAFRSCLSGLAWARPCLLTHHTISLDLYVSVCYVLTVTCSCSPYELEHSRHFKSGPVLQAGDVSDSLRSNWSSHHPVISQGVDISMWCCFLEEQVYIHLGTGTIDWCSTIVLAAWSTSSRYTGCFPLVLDSDQSG